MLFDVLSLMFYSDLLEGAACYFFIYGVGVCVFVYSVGVFVVKPTVILLIIPGGSQGFCCQWAGECQSSPIT